MSPLTAQRSPPAIPVAADEVSAYVVAAAVWAPSVHNTQPWWFAGRGAEIVVHADRRRQLKVADPAGREMLLSCGAALFTAKLALRSLGYVVETRLLPDPADPAVVARLRWRRRLAPTEYELLMFDQVTQRRSHRGGFGPLPLPSGLLAELRQEAQYEGAALRVAAEEGSRAAVAAAVEMAEMAERLEGTYVRELAAWAPPPGSLRRDGVSVLSYPARPTQTSPRFLSRDFAHGHHWGLPALSAATGAGFTGAVCLLTTPGDRPTDWLHAGMALQRILLTATTQGVAAALYSQPVEVPWVRELLRIQLHDGSVPQLVLRLGMVAQSVASARRPTESVLFLGGRAPDAGEIGIPLLAQARGRAGRRR